MTATSDMTLTCPDRVDNPDDPRHWMMYATCYGRWAEFDPDQICVARGWDRPTMGRIDPIARRQCAPCPVKPQCATWGLDTDGGIICAGWYLPHRTWESARKDDNVARVRERLAVIAAGVHL